ncbi:MAG: peptidoglycan editing factor PgeF [Beutenbergiaceae bacterium]
MTIDMTQVSLGPGVRAGFSSRAGGVSQAPYASLNLGEHVGDHPQHTHANRDILGRWLGAPVTFAMQVHGSDVAVVESAEIGPVREADALVSTNIGVGIGVMVADCVPVLLADSSASVVATAHAGRPGLIAGVVAGAIAAMVNHGAQPGSIQAAIGPSICGGCYEVPEPMRADVEAAVPGTGHRTHWGTPSVDIAAGVLKQLRACGVQQAIRVPGCTYEDQRFFSFRRDGVTGRFAGVITLI